MALTDTDLQVVVEHQAHAAGHADRDRTRHAPVRATAWTVLYRCGIQLESYGMASSPTLERPAAIPPRTSERAIDAAAPPRPIIRPEQAIAYGLVSSPSIGRQKSNRPQRRDGDMEESR